MNIEIEFLTNTTIITMLHVDCLMNIKCNNCKKEFCDHCQKECVHADELCPYCTKVYHVNYENYENDTDYHCEWCDWCSSYGSGEYDICIDCLKNLYYCRDCNIVYCHTSLHLDHNYEKINDLNMNKFEQHNEEVSGELNNKDIIHDIIELVCDDIYDIDKYMIKYKRYFEKDITYGNILYDLVNYSNDELKWFINYLYEKQVDVKSLINTNTRGKYICETPVRRGQLATYLAPPITNVKKLDNLKLLVEHGGNIHIEGVKPICTCLYTNVANIMDNYSYDDSVKIIHYLIENGVDVNRGNPLKLIIRRSHLDEYQTEIMKLLISKGGKNVISKSNDRIEESCMTDHV